MKEGIDMMSRISWSSQVTIENRCTVFSYASLSGVCSVSISVSVPHLSARVLSCLSIYLVILD